MIIERIVISISVLALIIIGQQYARPHKNKTKWLCYISAAAIWGVGQYWLQSTWIDMLISIIGIELFAWIITAYLDDQKK